MNPYIGHEQQIYGVEELRLVGGRADGMRMLWVRSGGGLELMISLDRCADLSRVTLSGVNLGYFSPCGYVAPQYYDNRGDGFLRSFTAGFLTTCGLSNVGSPCEDDGKAYPLHGGISHTPAEQVGYWIRDEEIYVRAVMRDAALFSHQLLLERTYRIPLFRKELRLVDRVRNIGGSETPVQILYHCNLGYPLLDENTVVDIPSEEVTPRNAHAASDIRNCLRMEPPQSGYEERCYYHTLRGEARVSVYHPLLKKGLVLSYDSRSLPCFTEWKMMGVSDYVLGIEPGNAYPDGRDVMREKGLLETLKPGEERTFEWNLEFKEGE